MDQKIMKERGLIDLVCSLRCPVDSFTDNPFVMVLNTVLQG